MSGPAKVGVYLILGIVGLVIVAKVLGFLLSVLVPLAIIGGIGLVIYGFATRNNSLTGGRRFLP